MLEDKERHQMMHFERWIETMITDIGIPHFLAWTRILVAKLSEAPPPFSLT